MCYQSPLYLNLSQPAQAHRVVVSNSSLTPTTGGTQNILNILTVDGTGNLVFTDQVNSWRTTNTSISTPRLIVEEPFLEAATFDIGTSFTVTEEGGLSTTAATLNQSVSTGSGYLARPTFTILPAADGAPGSGGAIVSTGGTFNVTGEFTWGGGFDVLTSGSGYLENLNVQSAARAFDADLVGSSFTLFIKAGETRTNNIDYGTGVRESKSITNYELIV